MKYYIVQDIQEYAIYKVAENLVNEFEAEKKECIVVQGSSIQEVLIAFDGITKLEDWQFNSEMVKYKAQQKEEMEESRIKHRQKM